MAGPSNINIVISLKNQASAPLKQVKRDVADFRDELVKFNRRLFTAAAVYQTFAQGFRKAFDFAEVGADFDMFRSQFERTFDGSYLKRLRLASKGTMDAMSMMQIAVQNHARGLKQAETEKIFTLSVGAAKMLKTTTVDAAKQMSKALQTLSVSGMQQFMVALNTNNQFKNMDLMIKRVTKGLNAAGLETNNFRRIALRELELALAQVSAESGDAKTLFMQVGASVESLRQVFGAFISRALAPFAATFARLNWDIFDKFNDLLDESNKKLKGLRQGLIDFIQVGGGVIAVSTAIIGGLSLLSLVSSTLGVTFGGMVGVLSLFFIGMKKAKDESGGFMQAIANMGTAMKFWYEAFTSYDSKTGKATFSGDVMERLLGMSEPMRNAIVFIGKGFALAKVGVLGFYDGLKSVFGLMTRMLSTFGVFDAKTKQFTSSTENVAKVIGVTLGAVAGIWALSKAGGVVGSVLGKIPGVSKIPGIGKLMGGGAGAGPKGTPLDPMYVKSVDGIAGGIAGAAGGMGMLGKAGMVGGAGLASYWLTSKLLEASGYKGEALGGLAMKMFGPNTSDFMTENGTDSMKMNNAFMGKYSTADQNIARQNDLSGMLEQMSAKGGSLDMGALNKLAEGGLTAPELIELIRSIRDFLVQNRPNQYVTSKPNYRDQTVR